MTERTQTQLTVRRFLRHRAAVAGLAAVVVLVLFAYGGAWIWEQLSGFDHETLTPDLSQPPSGTHPFGTDALGHDAMAQVMRGAQQSIKIAVLTALTATAVGTVWGAVAGFYRGAVDAIMMRISDLVLTLPLIAIAAVLGQLAEGNWLLVALVIAGLVWAYVSRVVRSVVLSIREMEFVEAAQAMGASDARIIFRHLVPNALGPVIVNGTILVAVAILVETGLSYLGFGVQKPDTSLGLLVSDAQGALSSRPWLFYFPGIVIILIALTINFIGDGLRDALDPRQTRNRA